MTERLMYWAKGLKNRLRPGCLGFGRWNLNPEIGLFDPR